MDIRFPVVFCLFLSYELCSKFSGWAYTQCHPNQPPFNSILTLPSSALSLLPVNSYFNNFLC